MSSDSLVILLSVAIVIVFTVLAGGVLTAMVARIVAR